MNENLSAILKDAGITTLLLGGAAATCAFGSPLVATIVGGVLTNILSNKVEKSKILEIQQLLQDKDPASLNHDIEKLIQQAMVWATKNIAYSYQPYCFNNEDRKQLDSVKGEIIEAIEKMDSTQWKASNELLNQIDGVADDNDLIKGLLAVNANWPTINPKFPFGVFFEDNFTKNFKLCFSQLLKDKNYRPALIAYNRNIANQIQNQLRQQDKKIDKILEGHVLAKQDLDGIKHTSTNDFQVNYVAPEVEKTLNDFIADLKKDVALLLDMNGNVLVGIDELKEESKYQTQKIEAIGRLVRKKSQNRILWLIIPVISLALTYFSYKYWSSKLPFTFTATVIKKLDNKKLPNSETEVTIEYNGKKETKTVEEGSVSFANLPSTLKRDSLLVRVYSHGFQTLDTLVHTPQCSFKLTRDDTYRWLKGRIKEADTSNAPIEGAKVTLDNIGLETFTDSNGRFEFDIPSNLQQTQHRLIVSKSGYLTWERIEPVISGANSIISIQKASNL